jgi:hypothetical protein
VYCHTLISPGFCPYCLRSNGAASKRLRQWTRNCTLMAHIEEEHANEACCNIEVKDANSIRHHLSDAHGLWRAEWREFGRKRTPDEEDEDVNRVSTPDPEDAGETPLCQRGKRAKPGDKFIEWSPSRQAQSPDPPSRQGQAGKTKASNNAKVSAVVAPTFISWSPPAAGGSSDLPSGQYRRLGPGEPAIAIQSSSNHYPDPDWDSPSVTEVNDEEGASDGQALLDLPPQSGDRPHGVLPRDSLDNALWPEDSSLTEYSTTDPTSVSEYATDTGPVVFEDLLDPALLGSESPTSQPLSRPSSQDITTHQSDGEDEDDLPTLESLLNYTPTHLSSKSHNTLGARGPCTNNIREEESFAMQSAHHEPAPVSDDSLVSQKSCGGPVEHPRRGPQVVPTPKKRSKRLQSPKKQTKRLQSPKKQTKRLSTWEQTELSRARELEDAESEWAQCGYPRIGWRSLSSRLEKFSSALRVILNGTSPSFAAVRRLIGTFYLLAQKLVFHNSELDKSTTLWARAPLK